MIHTTFKSVENGITCCCNLGGLKIRRKTRTPDTGKISWWFVIHADEAVLCELASKWESVNLQTSWQLQTCLKPAVVIEETHADDTGSFLEDKYWWHHWNDQWGYWTMSPKSTSSISMREVFYLEETLPYMFMLTSHTMLFSLVTVTLNILFCLSHAINLCKLCTDLLIVVLMS